MVIAIIGIGYADGFLRNFNNKCYVYYKKFKFRIIGRISMDTITIDITKYHKMLKEGMIVDLINYSVKLETGENLGKVIKFYDFVYNIVSEIRLPVNQKLWAVSCS